MNFRTPLAAVLGAFVLLAGQPAAAKLPALSPEAQAKADETKAKAAWTEKVGAYKLCQAQDRIAAQYRQTAGASAKPAIETPPCADPGPFSPTAGTPPLEAAGAHSPAKTAATPPNTATPQAEQQGGVKK